jgi:parallel beta-helix repeat protein
MRSLSPDAPSHDPERRTRAVRRERWRRPGGAWLAACLLVSCSTANRAGQLAPAAPSNVPVPADGQPPDPSWVSIYPGTSIQETVNAYPGATTFYVRAGTHRRQTVKPKSGNAFIGESGATLDGENTAEYAFEGVRGGSTNVTIRGLEITRYASRSQRGALQGDSGTNWVVEDNSVHDNAAIGVRTGPGWQVRRNKVYRNGVIGISGYQADGVIIEENEIFENNWSQVTELPRLAEAAGIKFGVTANAVIRNNHVHHNFAKGIWFDRCNPTTIIEGNAVTDNSSHGIWAEISYDLIIRNNISERNGASGSASWLGGAGIQVTNSPQVEIYGNTVRDNANGITAMQSSGTAAAAGAHGRLRVENLYVHDNVIAMQVGRTGISQNTGEAEVYTTWNNRFERNTYYLGPNNTYFAWQEKSLTESQWRATGNDTTATFIR